MKRSTFLLLAVIGYGIFGVGLLLLPVPFMAVYGVSLDAGGTLMSRVLGSALISLALLFWWSRNAPRSDSLLAILRANCIYNLVDIPVIILALSAGVLGPMGWMPLIIHILYFVGFGYFGFMQREEHAAAPATRMGMSA
jgi:hypothetical protein